MDKKTLVQNFLNEAQGLPEKDFDQLINLCVKTEQELIPVIGDPPQYKERIKAICVSLVGKEKGKGETPEIWQERKAQLVDTLNKILADTKTPALPTPEASEPVPPEPPPTIKQAAPAPPQAEVESKSAAAATEIETDEIAAKGQPEDKEEVSLAQKPRKPLWEVIRSLLARAQKDAVTPSTSDAPFPLDPNFIPVPQDKKEEPVLKRIFVVHGEDEEWKNEILRRIASLGLEAVVSRDRTNSSKPLIQKFAEFSDIGFALILLSFDEFAYNKKQKAKDAKLKPLPNVIFELGFLIGKLGRNNVFVLYPERKNFELPSQYSDALYVPFDREDGIWLKEFKSRLKNAGYLKDIQE